MSRSRLKANVRKNVDYIEAVRVLDGLGLDYELLAPRGRGHPVLLVEGTLRWPVASSPKPGQRVGNVRAGLLRRLRAAGLTGAE